MSFWLLKEDVNEDFDGFLKWSDFIDFRDFPWHGFYELIEGFLKFLVQEKAFKVVVLFVSGNNFVEIWKELIVFSRYGYVLGDFNLIAHDYVLIEHELALVLKREFFVLILSEDNFFIGKGLDKGRNELRLA